MNYRHAFHAGNFADCMKHAVLVWLLRALARKPAPFMVLDTHAGAGRYDLTSGPAERTGEWRAGIGRLLEDPAPALQDYLNLVIARGLYPGSPVLARALLREQDSLVCCELHPEEHAALRALFRGDRQVAVHRRDGWEALGALLPPAQKRGLVLIDPPYEISDEFKNVLKGLSTVNARFPGAIAAAWYPIKHRAPVRTFHVALRASGLRDVVAAELWLRPPLDPARLNGCGLVILNPPFRLDVDIPQILASLASRLSDAEADFALERLADE